MYTKETSQISPFAHLTVNLLRYIFLLVLTINGNLVCEIPTQNNWVQFQLTPILELQLADGDEIPCNKVNAIFDTNLDPQMGDHLQIFQETLLHFHSRVWV